MRYFSNLHAEMRDEELRLQNPCPKCSEGEGCLIE